MEVDVFTLFPQWFEWFSSQRHMANALAAGLQLRCVNYREHTPLSGGQVDDTPFGGGAGMLLRVDVVDSALSAHYGLDAVRLALDHGPESHHPREGVGPTFGGIASRSEGRGDA